MQASSLGDILHANRLMKKKHQNTIDLGKLNVKVFNSDRRQDIYKIRTISVSNMFTNTSLYPKKVVFKNIV